MWPFLILFVVLQLSVSNLLMLWFLGHSKIEALKSRFLQTYEWENVGDGSTQYYCFFCVLYCFVMLIFTTIRFFYLISCVKNPSLKLTASLHLNMDGWKTFSFPFGMAYFE